MFNQKEAEMPHEWVNYKSLREELSFIEILHHYGVELKERGEQWQGFCPLPTHEGKRNSPSFSANVGRGIWQCFGCGAKGNLIEFAARMEGLNPDNPDDFRKAALLLRKTFEGSDGGEREKPKAPPKEEKRERSAQEDLDEEEIPGSVVNAPLDFELQRLEYDHPYLRERGFTEETIKAFGLGYCHRGLMKGRIAVELVVVMPEKDGEAPLGVVVNGEDSLPPASERHSKVERGGALLHSPLRCY
jgi:DNA primase